MNARSETPPEGPLAGVRVMELATSLSAPFAAMILADQGADVIKVESPAGDPIRHAGRRRAGTAGLGSVFLGANRNKRSVVMDLKDPAEQARAAELAASCDVLIQNLRPGAAARIGLGYDRLAALRPDLIYVSVDGVGPVGPGAGRRYYDVAIQGLSGFAAVQADPETGAPRVVQTAVVDKVCSLTVAQAVSSALFARAQGRGGQHLRVSMARAAVAFLWPDAMGEAALQGPDVAPSADMSSIRYVFAARDGHLIVGYVTDADWRSLCEAIERPDLAADPRFVDMPGRSAHPEAINAALAETFATRPLEAWLERLARCDAIFAPVRRPAEAPDDPLIQACGAVETHVHPHAGPLSQAAPAAEFSATPARIRRPAPLLGEHTEEVLAELSAARGRR